MDRKDIKIIGLVSGGLDSCLAITHMHRLGFQVIAYHFANGFHAALHAVKAKPMVLATAARLGIPVKVVDNSEELLAIVKQPGHGYGSNMNPCIDCRIMAFRIARRKMEEEGARFIFTGEVVGQRPMSQRRYIMMQIDREADVEGLIVRPLCGQLLPKTLAEREGLFRNDELLAFSGRTRKPQMALAREFGIETYESPAGGCTLTDPGFSLRMRDALRFMNVDVREVQLLKVGRQFRLSERSKVVLGRDAADCEKLASLLGPEDVALEARDQPGPLATIRGEATPEVVRQAAALVLRYGKGGAEHEREHVVTVKRGGAVVEEVAVRPASEAEANQWLLAVEGGCGGYKDQVAGAKAGKKKEKSGHERSDGAE